MIDWYCLNLGDGITASGALHDIEEAFNTQFGPEPAADDVAVFCQYINANQLQCEVRVYFSPGSATLAESLKATPCAPPLAAELSLLAGTVSAWDVLFS